MQPKHLHMQAHLSDSPQIKSLRALFKCAVSKAYPTTNLAHYLPPPPDGQVVVVGAGKAGAAMAKAEAAVAQMAKEKVEPMQVAVATAAKAMTAALNEEVDQAAVCTDSDQKWCDAQIDFMVTTTKVAKDREEAIQMALKPDSFLNPKCKPCYAPKPEKNDTSTKEPPFSPKAGLYQGLQFLSVGGANRNGLINAQLAVLIILDTLFDF